MVYLIKWAIALTLLYSLYGLTLRRETFHTLNRAVLLVILVVSAVLPLFHIPLGHETWLSQGFERLENALAPQPDETFLSGQSTQIRRLHDDDAAIAQSSSCNRTITIQQSNKPGSFHWATIFIGTYTLVTIAFWLAYLHIPRYMRNFQNSRMATNAYGRIKSENATRLYLGILE